MDVLLQNLEHCHRPSQIPRGKINFRRHARLLGLRAAAGCGHGSGRGCVLFLGRAILHFKEGVGFQPGFDVRPRSHCSPSRPWRGQCRPGPPPRRGAGVSPAPGAPSQRALARACSAAHAGPWPWGGWCLPSTLSGRLYFATCAVETVPSPASGPCALLAVGPWSCAH